LVIVFLIPNPNLLRNGIKRERKEELKSKENKQEREGGKIKLVKAMITSKQNFFTS
jgi:hypothetical protein